MKTKPEPVCKTNKYGDKFWYLNGKWHREDGPARQYWYENGQKKYEIWYLDNNKWHREDGPARQGWYENGNKKYEQWWLNGKEYTRAEWIKELYKINPTEARKQEELIEIENFKL